MATQMIPKGYKKTEVGVIPVDWFCIESNQAISYIGGFGFSSNLSTISGVKWLKIANVGLNEIKWSVKSYLPRKLTSIYKEYLLEVGDVVMALTRPLLKEQLKVARLREKDLPAFLNQRVAKLKAKSLYSLNYLYFSVQRLNFVIAMNLSMAGTDPPNIGTLALGKIKIAFPPNKQEQTLIATALSDIDALIKALEKLLAKKQDIKTASMQQLLTGKTRLPPFNQNNEATKQTELGEIPGDWAVKKLGEILHFKNGLNKAKEFFGHGKPIINYMDVYNFNGLKKTNVQGKVDVSNDEINNYSVKIGDLFFTRTSETVDEIGMTTVLLENLENAVFSGFILRGRDKINALSLHFKRYCFSSNYVRKQIESTSSYTTRALTNGRLLSDISIMFPNSSKEQIAIAKVLSDMDNEIDSIKTQLTKTKQIKQGMMQELLTGRTRLI